MAEGFFCCICAVLVWDGLLAELLDLLAVEVRLLAELDGIPTLYYGIRTEGGYRWNGIYWDLMQLAFRSSEKLPI